LGLLAKGRILSPPANAPEPTEAPWKKWQSLAASGYQPTSIGSRRQFQPWLESGPQCQSHQHIQTELTEFTALDIGHPSLRDAQRLRGLSLRQARWCHMTGVVFIAHHFPSFDDFACIDLNT
jgi:hypothetical protein